MNTEKTINMKYIPIFLVFLMTISMQSNAQGWRDATIVMQNGSQLHGEVKLDNYNLQTLKLRTDEGKEKYDADSIDYILMGDGTKIVSRLLNGYYLSTGKEIQANDSRSFFVVVGEDAGMSIVAREVVERSGDGSSTRMIEYYITLDGDPNAYAFDVQMSYMKVRRKSYNKLNKKTIRNVFEDKCPELVEHVESHKGRNKFFAYEQILNDYGTICNGRQ